MFVIWKHYLGGQIWYRTLVPPIKNGANAINIWHPTTSGVKTDFLVFLPGILPNITAEYFQCTGDSVTLILVSDTAPEITSKKKVKCFFE